MSWLRNWWSSWKQIEAETDLHLGRDERYRQIEGEAYRSAVRTLPFTMLAFIAAGMLWLPETVSKTAVLQLAFLSVVIVMSVFWLTVRLLMERQGAGWVDPAITLQTVILSFISMAIIFAGGFLILTLVADMSFTWSTTIGMVSAWLLSTLLYAYRWHRQKGHEDG